MPLCVQLTRYPFAIAINTDKHWTCVARLWARPLVGPDAAVVYFAGVKFFAVEETFGTPVVRVSQHR